jgi:hypothetical protein
MEESVFDIVERIFNLEVLRESKLQDQIDGNVYICCNDEEKNYLIELAKQIKIHPTFRALYYRDILIVLTAIQYQYIRLEFNIQPDYYKTFLTDKVLGSKLYTEIEDMFVIERIFNNNLQSNITVQGLEITNFCCNEDDTNYVIYVAFVVTQYPKYSGLSIRDTFIVLIALYYSLRLSEQTGDQIPLEFYKRQLYNKTLGEELFYDISYKSTEKEFIIIRRHILGLSGGKRAKHGRKTSVNNKKNRKRKTTKKQRGTYKKRVIKNN